MIFPMAALIFSDLIFCQNSFPYAVPNKMAPLGDVSITKPFFSGIIRLEKRLINIYKLYFHKKKALILNTAKYF